MRTASPVRNLALYVSKCCSEETLFDFAECFSRCPKCQKLCDWDLVEEVISWRDMDEWETAPEAEAA
jgi:hypothetical protein